jgi:hypothetical protein
MNPKRYFAGDQVGGWTLLSYAGRNQRKKRIWNCRCVCGTERVIEESKLRSHGTYSCGCQPHRARVMNF